MLDLGLGFGRSIYILWGIGALGLLLKLMANIHMKRMIKASSNMATTKKRALRIMRLKYMNGKNLGINNGSSEAFVEKNVRSMRYLGVPLYVWRRTGMLFSLLIAGMVAGSFLYYYVSWRGSPEMVTFIANGTMICAFLIITENIFLINNKLEILKANIRDYFDNQPGKLDLVRARDQPGRVVKNADQEVAATMVNELSRPEKNLADAKKELEVKLPHIENVSADVSSDEVILNSFLKEFFS
ncbi:MAG: hypothetical protein IJV15_06665 [Lachnospiraceae bacterium]|nr:hypothetical protein [Lachnospiraceae bacterium]